MSAVRRSTPRAVLRVLHVSAVPDNIRRNVSLLSLAVYYYVIQGGLSFTGRAFGRF